MANPKPSIKIRGEFCIESRPASCGMVIFGASGDLMARKLLPALFTLFRRKLLPARFFVAGSGRSRYSDDAFRLKALDDLNRFAKNFDRPVAERFIEHLVYQPCSYDDKEGFRRLAGRLEQLREQFQTGGSVVFYLSTPPAVYALVTEGLSAAGMLAEDRERFARVVIEKPFGHDLDSALDLDRGIQRFLEERQIYRIDHYLGKETVQNLLMFRFANAIFEPLWNRQYIDHVQITVAESIGVGQRAGYFEQAGIMRDMFQNHLLQMLAMIAKEPPASFEADRVRDERVKLLRSIRPIRVEEAARYFVRGQYVAGTVGGKVTPGYLEEDNVAPHSRTETFVAARLMIDNWRWQGVPFYLRSGKRLARRVSEIAITFKRVPHSMFSPIGPDELLPNTLVFTVQPDESVSLHIQAKHPGPHLCMSHLKMDFVYSEVFEEQPPEAYERLLLDTMLGDQTLFVRHDDMAVAWSLITPLLHHWDSGGGALHPYEPGGSGPDEAHDLIARDGRAWRPI